MFNDSANHSKTTGISIVVHDPNLVYVCIPNFLANVLASSCGAGQGSLVVIDLLVDCLGGVVSSVSMVERRGSDVLVTLFHRPSATLP